MKVTDENSSIRIRIRIWDTDSLIRIRTKQSRIRNTGSLVHTACLYFYFLALLSVTGFAKWSFQENNIGPGQQRLSSDWCFLDSVTAERFFRSVVGFFFWTMIIDLSLPYIIAVACIVFCRLTFWHEFVAILSVSGSFFFWTMITLSVTSLHHCRLLYNSLIVLTFERTGLCRWEVFSAGM